MLWFALLGTLWISYTTWVTDHRPVPDAAGQQSVNVEAPPATGETELPSLGSSSDSAGDTANIPALPTAEEPVAPANTIHVRTDVYDILIDLAGGDIVRADLLEYPVHKSDPDTLVRLLDYAPATRWVFQTGFRAAADGPEPNHLAMFHAAEKSYTLAPGADTLTVKLDWAGGNGLTASKIYTFRRGEYAIDLDLEVTNGTSAPWRALGYSQLVRQHNPVKRTYLNVETYSYNGPVLFDGSESEKLKVDDLRQMPVDQTATGGWLASIEHHFLAAIVPPPDEAIDYQAVVQGGQYVLRALSPVEAVAPGAMLDYSLKLFVGPKLQDQLRATANKLDLTVDYGRLTLLAHPLFLVLDHVHGWIGNWGWSIIIVTFLIKLVFYKLTATSGRSMAKMRKLAPRMKALQERYKDDRQALSQAMMKLYKDEKVNPAAGCLPMLIQMPFFFSFYWVLVESVEMRQVPFMLWINDLSVRDPYFVLPLLMGAAMLFQTRLNPAPPDPVQARVMQIMPIAFTAMFAFFPAGLVLYWLTNTVTSIAQQWRINTLVARES
jgi:YidC/Oxa1 family membrane protein insertase